MTAGLVLYQQRTYQSTTRFLSSEEQTSLTLSTLACLFSFLLALAISLRFIAFGAITVPTVSSVANKLVVPGCPADLFFFLIAGCNGSLGYWQSLATRE